MSKITYNNSSASKSRISNTSGNHIFNNITKSECITIYENIKNNKTIYNPNTNRQLKYDSPITQKILQECYKKYKMKELPNSINPRNLFGNKTPPVLSPNSPPGVMPKSPPGVMPVSPPGVMPNSPPGAKTNKPISPPGVMPNSPPGAKTNKPKSPPGVMPKSPPGAKTNKPVSPPGVMPNSPPGAKTNKPVSPPGVMPNSPPNQISIRIPLLDYSDVGDLDKKTKNDIITKVKNQDCDNIIQELANNKNKIINPISNQLIGNKSNITKYILYHCYHNLNNKNIEKIAKVETLSKKKDLTKKTHELPNDYTTIYNKFNDLRSNYSDDKLEELLNQSNLNIDIDLFKDFIKSCKLIENKQTIPYENIVENHFNCIINLLSKIKTTNYIVCYDNKFVEDLKLLSSKRINCVIDKNKFIIKSILLSSDSLYHYENIYESVLNPFSYSNLILINAIFSRILIFNYTGTKQIICPSKLNSSLAIKLYNKRIPTKFAHNFSDKIKTNNKFNYITAFLNCFSQAFADNINVEDKKSIDHFNNISSLYPNLTERECQDLTTILLNNSRFAMLKKTTNILATNFDGTVCQSTLDKMAYLYDILENYQPYKIPIQTLNNIENNYKNRGIKPYSRELNIELSNLLKDPKIELTMPVKLRLMAMFEFNKNTNLAINYDKGLFVFHGTAEKLNSNVITSFLSTSLNINVAIKYSHIYTNPHIYIFKIKNIDSTNAKYITFKDQLQQILLLPGTQLIEHNCFDYFNYKFIFCDVIMPTQTFINKLQKEIEDNESKYKIKLYNYDLNNYTINNYINIITYNTTSYSRFRNNVYITDDNQYLFCNLLFETLKQSNQFLNLKYTIHQLVINNIYNFLVPNNTIKYNLINYYNNGEILVGWKYDSTLTPTNKNPNYKYDFALLLPDIFCNNTDLANNLSYLVAQDNKLKRVWFKTTGIFNGVAGQDITLDDLVPGILNKIFEEKKNKIINTVEIYNNNKINVSSIIKTSYDKLVEFKTTNQLKNILDEQMNLITNILKIPSDSEEYKDLVEMFDIILKYMTAKIDFVLNLDIDELIKTINNKMKISGGKIKKYSSSSSEKITQKKSKTKTDNELYASTDPTRFDEYGYEITNVSYSSTQTISLAAFKGILKKYYT